TAAGPNPPPSRRPQYLKTNRMHERRQNAPASSVPHRVHACAVDEQETLRKPRVAGHNLRSRPSALCIIASTVLHGEHTSREGQTRPTPEFRMALVTAGTQTIRPVSDGAYCASFRPALSLSWFRSSFRRSSTTDCHGGNARRLLTN